MGLAAVRDCPRTDGYGQAWVAGFLDYITALRRIDPGRGLFHVKHGTPCAKAHWTEPERQFLWLARGRLPDAIVADLLGRPGDAVRLKRQRLRTQYWGEHSRGDGSGT